jgi:hypothetical protein
VTLVWGLFFTGSGTLALACSIAEMASMCPISGAQYHWTYMFAPKKWRVQITFLQGMFATKPELSTASDNSRMGYRLRMAGHNHFSNVPHRGPDPGNGHPELA